MNSDIVRQEKRRIQENIDRNVRRRDDTIITNESQYSRRKSTVVTETVKISTSNKKRVKITISLVDKFLFKIHAEWDDQLNRLLRSESSRYERNYYFFLLSKYTEIMKKISNLEHLDPNIEGEIPTFVSEMLAYFDKLKSSNDEIDLYERIDKSTVDKLHDYQKEGITFAIRLNARCFFADEMGLGKSVQSLCAMKWFEQDWPLLIICTKSLVPKWKDDVKKWLPNIKDSDIYTPLCSKDLLERKPITIINFHLLSNHKEELEIDCIYRSMIIDESHNVKDISSQRTKTCLNIAQKFMKHVILLSGTPVLNRPKELWSQLSMVYENFPNWLTFAKRYCDPQIRIVHARGGKMIRTNTYEGATNIDELNILITNTFMLQRTKNEKLTLPPKIRELSAIEVDLSSQDKELMDDYDKSIDAVKVIPEKNQGPNKDILAWFRDTAKVKAPAVVKRLEKLIKSEVKMIIFFHHQTMRNEILEMLNRTQTNHIVIDGSTSMSDRQEAVEIFQTKKKFRVALLSLKSCNTGLNLTAANVVVFAELYWTPAELHQAEARIHRIGQTKPCRCIYLFAKKTVDEKIYKNLIAKLNVISQAGLKTDENFDRLFLDQKTLDDFITRGIRGEGTSQDVNNDDTKPKQEKEDDEEFILDDELDDFFLDDDLDDLLREVEA